MQSIRIVFCIILWLSLAGISYAQDEPSPEPQQDEGKAKEEGFMVQPVLDSASLNLEYDSVYVDKETLNRPKKVAFLSAVLPGLGQASINRYWKIPIIYGAFGTIGYYIGWNNNKYQQYRNAYLQKKSYPPEELDDPLAINISEDNLQRGIDYFRRNRDFLMIVLVGVYVIQILDANIDAHLMDFDISEDLTFRMEPGIEPQTLWTVQQYGIKLTLNFN
jgi:hypothetical protein